MTNRKYWLGFSLVPEIGPKRLAQLIQWFGDAEPAWRATETQLRQAGLDDGPRGNLLRVRAQLDLDAQMAKIERLGARLVTRADVDYPELLKNIADAPGVLYVKGTLRAEDRRALALVGTRKATAYGKDAARMLARELAEQRITVVSGMAHGIDAAAHRGALEAGGRTIAVLGCGIDIVYPSDHRVLADEIASNGALLSEYPPGTKPEPGNFPRRNRLISGLSLGVVVVEAPEESGALITAEFAAEQGRDVFAVPGSIFSRMSRGANRLIQDGAKLVNGIDDILDEMEIVYQGVETREVAERLAPGNELEARLVAQLGSEPTHVDDLARLCALPVAVVSGTLTVLELKGLVRMVGPMQYCLPLEN